MQTNRRVDLEKFTNAVGFTATFSAWGNRRKADMSQVQTDSDKSRLSLSKQLIVSEEYDAIKSALGQMRQWIYSRTVPSFFKEGFQLASLEAKKAIDARLIEFTEKELPPLVAALVKAYPSHKATSEIALGSQYSERDYPSEAQLQELFGLEWFWVDFTPAKAMSDEERKAEADKINKKMEDAGSQIIDALRAAFGELITHASERLTPGPDGKLKTFRDSLIGNISEFLETFNSRNLMNDTELAALVAKAQTVLAGADPDKLRKYSSVRENTAAQFKEIKATLDTMIETKKGRVFDLSE